MVDISYNNANGSDFSITSQKDIDDINKNELKDINNESQNLDCHEDQAEVDQRFQPKKVLDVQVKKSFLTSSSSNGQNLNQSCASNSKNSLLTACTEKRGSLLTNYSQTIYSISIAIKNSELDKYGCMTFKSLPSIEMSLDDDLTVESVIREIIEKLNIKLQQELIQRFKSENIPSSILNDKCYKFYEISETNKKGEPKGCSFDNNQMFRQIGCKQQLALRIIDSSAYDPLLLKLLPKPKKQISFPVSPIPEQEDDTNSIARATSHYKDSLISKEMDPFLFNRLSGINSANSGNPSLIHQSTHSADKSGSSFSSQQFQNKEAILQEAMHVQPKKLSFWRRFFNCGVICQ